MRFRSIADEPEIERLVSLGMRRNALTSWVTSSLERGEWCRMACSDEGELLAAHIVDSWSLDGGPGETPTFVQLLGHVDEAAATALLGHDLAVFDAKVVGASVVIAVDAPAELRALRERQPDLLAAAGFRPKVDRIRLSWPADATTPRPTGRLTFRPAAAFPAAELRRIFAEVADGSVDHGEWTTRAEIGREAEATGPGPKSGARRGQVRHRPGPGRPARRVCPVRDGPWRAGDSRRDRCRGVAAGPAPRRRVTGPRHGSRARRRHRPDHQ